MYERFTDRARLAMQLANQGARSFNHEYVGTEHILLGLVEEGRGVACNVLMLFAIDEEKVRDEVVKIVQLGRRPGILSRLIFKKSILPKSPGGKEVIMNAIDEAEKLKHDYVGTEHLLLGLLRVQEGTAAQILNRLGLRLEIARERILQLLGRPPE